MSSFVANGAMSFAQQLLLDHPLLRIKDVSSVDSKLKSIINGGHEKLQFIVDFDNTLTRHHKNGKLLDCSWGVMESSPLLPPAFTEKTNALRAKYLPIELNPDLTVEEKAQHWIILPLS